MRLDITQFCGRFAAARNILVVIGDDILFRRKKVKPCTSPDLVQIRTRLRCPLICISQQMDCSHSALADIGQICPMSFLAGEYFAKLRHLADRFSMHFCILNSDVACPTFYNFCERFASASRATHMGRRYEHRPSRAAYPSRAAKINIAVGALIPVACHTSNRRQQSQLSVNIAAEFGMASSKQFFGFV